MFQTRVRDYSLKEQILKKNYADKLKWDTRFFLNHVNKHSRKEHLRSPKG